MKNFKAESKRLLDLMINSIYTNKEIFLRELISNASDAIDKRHFASLTDSNLVSDFKIVIEQDKEKRTLKITDNGCGMDKQSLEDNLGTIAKSGTLKFKEENKTPENLIGQFGVGFYAAFMVANSVTVISRAIGADKAFKWQSSGTEGYTIEECEFSNEGAGTEVTLVLKDNDDDCQYEDYLEEYTIKRLIKKYSDYIRYPIKIKDETLNSMVPIWRKPKSQVTDEQYNEFYKDKFFDYNDPIKVISANVEGNINYSVLLFVPKKVPHDYYTKEYARGLKLFSNGVMIMDNSADLLPEHFGFVKGLIDSSDISLNISREMLQKDRQLRAISTSVEKRIISEFKKMMDTNRETYDEMFQQFGASIKMGAYANFGMKKDELKDLLEFSSSFSDKMTTFKEYVSRLKEGQDVIYFASGEKRENIAVMPKTEALLSEGYEVLYLTNNIDEFVLKVIDEYEGKKFVSVNDKAAIKETEEEKNEVKAAEDKNKKLLDFMKDTLGGKVKAVRLTNGLKNAAACVSSDNEISMEMEKVLNAMPTAGAKAERVLELNPKHAVFNVLLSLQNGNTEKLGEYTKLLYDAALLQGGLEIDDTAALSMLITKLLV